MALRRNAPGRRRRHGAVAIIDPRVRILTILAALDAANACGDVAAAQAHLRELPDAVGAWLTDTRDAGLVTSLRAYAERWTAITPRADDFFNALALVLGSLRERLRDDEPTRGR